MPSPFGILVKLSIRVSAKSREPIWDSSFSTRRPVGHRGKGNIACVNVAGLRVASHSTRHLTTVTRLCSTGSIGGCRHTLSEFRWLGQSRPHLPGRAPAAKRTPIARECTPHSRYPCCRPWSAQSIVGLSVAFCQRQRPAVTAPRLGTNRLETVPSRRQTVRHYRGVAKPE